jgi:hypothetical protein
MKFSTLESTNKEKKKSSLNQPLNKSISHSSFDIKGTKVSNCTSTEKMPLFKYETEFPQTTKRSHNKSLKDKMLTYR